MKSKRYLLLTAVLALMVLAAPVLADGYLESLKPGQKISGFSTLNLYENGQGKAMGARFISDKYGFIVDLMQIQSVPQAFYWVKTPPTSSMGEPHACEHLLLGKGNRGRYVAALEDMALGSSTAYTAQVRTCYHFNTTAGAETFYEIFEAKLQAFLHPDFADEEIRREVCHIGVNADPRTGELSLDEKGTVYTEMVSAFEKPWYHVYGRLNESVYGKNHPLGYCAGGDPDIMREMVPDDMWKFHKDYYRLSNMGAIVSIPNEITVEAFLARMDEILNDCQAEPEKGGPVGINAIEYPDITDAAPVGIKKLVNYPSEKNEDPGYIIFAWPVAYNIDYTNEIILDFFLDALAGGQTSNLYKMFINSETRIMDIGGQYVSAGFDNDQGISIYMSLVGVDNRHVTETMLDSVKNIMVGEIRRITELPADSDELADFNQRIKNRIIQTRKYYESNLNSPPMFGYRRGPAGQWLGLMSDLEKIDGFRKSMVFKELVETSDSILSLDKNIWAELVPGWHILDTPPYEVGATPSPDILAANAEAKNKRIQGYIDDFKKKYAVADDQAAIAAYKEDFDKKTAELDALASKQNLPGFIDNPPMTLDDQLDYQTITLPGDIPLVASTFENMNSSRVGLALDLNVVPESLLVYLQFMPQLLTDIGVIKDGETIRYDEMEQRLRREVLNLGAYFSSNGYTGRAEMVVAGEGSNLDELKNALDWMDAALYSPYLSIDNLSRLQDLADQSITSQRNRMKRSEEDWVDGPSNGYRYQDNPLIMTTNCFLTGIHNFERIKWFLTDPGNDAQQNELRQYLDDLAAAGRDKNREELVAMLTSIEHYEEEPADPAISDSKPALLNTVDQAAETAVEIAKSLKMTLNDIPDDNLAADWTYLCAEIKHDLMVPPEETLGSIKKTLSLIRNQGGARTFMISNSADRAATIDKLTELVGKLDKTPAVRQDYAAKNRVFDRLKGRRQMDGDPVYAGLNFDGTNNGVLMFNAKIADRYDTSQAAVLNCLTGKLYGGGGPHGIFMNTWAAGLAYSNGYGYSPASGRVSYYAERCPDVAETMRFVVNFLKSSEPDEGLLDYSIAQVFGATRAGSKYERRGEAMASDLADGIKPDMVRAFRQKVLSMRDDDKLLEKLAARMEETYGPVLIGYGPSLTESADASLFLIGPEPQFESLEQYIKTAEGEQTVQRLYPRDFWLTL